MSKMYTDRNHYDANERQVENGKNDPHDMTATVSMPDMNPETMNTLMAKSHDYGVRVVQESTGDWWIYVTDLHGTTVRAPLERVNEEKSDD